MNPSRVVLKEFIGNGKTYRLYFPTEETAKAIGIVRHNMNAHRQNGNPEGLMLAAAEWLAIVLTPDGMDPVTKDREKVKEEILSLPYGSVVKIIGELMSTLAGLKDRKVMN